MTPEQEARLPKYAIEELDRLRREHANMKRTLEEFRDSQTEAPFSYEEYNHVDGVHTPVTRFIQTHKITVVRDGVLLDICVPGSRPGIELKWGTTVEGARRMRFTDHVGFIPDSFQSAVLLPVKDMRDR